jgi:ABC-type transport system substrate-binding protein/PKD repeat protein
MDINIGKSSVRRLVTVSAVLLGIVLVATPIGVLENASASEVLGMDVDRVFVVGLRDMSISTLNPNAYSTASEAMAIFPCYSSLLQYDEDSRLIGDLARTWSMDNDGLVWHFDLSDQAYFCDPNEPTLMDHQVTSEDVVFTYTSIQDEAASKLHYALPGIIADITADNPFSVTITLNQPFAPFLDSLANIPILPKYIWEDERLTDFDNVPLVGSGPFYYATNGIPTAGTAILRKNPNWFMTEERGWSLRVDSWILKEEPTDGTALTDLSDGSIDFMVDVPAYAFVDLLPDWPYVTGYSQSAGFVFELNLNQMTDEMRDSLGGAFRAGENNQLLLDPVVKNAIAMCVDKQSFVDETVMGLGEPADSLVPNASPWHYDYPDPVLFDTLAAREMLMNAGWAYDRNGVPATQETLPLCRALGVDPLSFRFCTPDSPAMWMVGAELIVNWCAEAGIELDLDLKSLNEMNTVWYSADYDMWLWDWVFDPLGDPATSILEVLTTDAIGLDSDVFYSNPVFDALYYKSLVTMDPEERADIIDEMQAMAYEDMSCQCVAYRDDLYAASTWHWMDFGDLDSRYMLLPDVSSQWISLCMSPVDNPAPLITTANLQEYGIVGEAVEFCVSAMDEDASTLLECRWFWGDGTKTDWIPLGTGYGTAVAQHVYEEQGVYTFDVAVRETSASNNVDDFFVTSIDGTVVVADMFNQAPVILGVEYYPPDPDTATLIAFEADAYDPEDNPLEYTWDFGDGTGADGQSVTHRFPAAGLYEVTLSVTDNIIGTGTRPVTLTVQVEVDDNLPPTLVVPDFEPTDPRTETAFHVDAGDPDGDLLMFTWDWGDGTTTVTYEATATHSYRHGGTYVITVTVSDLTGLEGHEVSDSGTVYVSKGQQKHGGTVS